MRAAKGKECNSNQDCVLIVETSCVKDYDHVNRCLCGNYEGPRNGKCEKGPKGVRHRCSHDGECDEYMVCKENNSTKGTFVGSYGRTNSMIKESKLDFKNLNKIFYKFNFLIRTLPL
jgi:hypothetical protein